MTEVTNPRHGLIAISSESKGHLVFSPPQSSSSSSVKSLLFKYENSPGGSSFFLDDDWVRSLLPPEDDAAPCGPASQLCTKSPRSLTPLASPSLPSCRACDTRIFSSTGRLLGLHSESTNTNRSPCVGRAKSELAETFVTTRDFRKIL